MRGCLRRSQRARNRHFSHLPARSAARAPQAHCRPLRHPFNSRPMLITSCQRPLAFRKLRSARNAASPDTIGSGNTAFPFRAAPRRIPLGWGQPGHYSVSVSRAPCLLRPRCRHHSASPRSLRLGAGPRRIHCDTGRGLVGHGGGHKVRIRPGIGLADSSRATRSAMSAPSGSLSRAVR